MQTDELSPFVEPLRQGVDNALRDFFGVPPFCSLEWSLQEDGPDPELKARITDGAGSELVVELKGLLASRTESGPAERTMGLHFSVPTSPVARALKARIRRLLTGDAGAVPESVDKLRRAVADWFPYRDNTDIDYRKISPAPQGQYGTLRLGYRCNQKCHFCWQGREWPGAPDERYEAWLEEMAAAGVGDLNITGGEPTIFPNLLPLIEQARGHGMRVSIQSNCIRLGQPAFAQQLFDLGLVAVMASYHCADASVSDRMTAAPGTHTRTVRGITAALKAGIKVSLTCVVERANVEDLVAHAQDIVQRFVEPFGPALLHRVAYAHPTSYYEAAAWTRCQVDFETIRPQLVQACRVLEDAGVPVQVIGSCGFPTCILRGEPTLIQSQMVHRSMFDSDQLSHRRYAPVCQGCAIRDECFGLRQEYLDTFGSAGLEAFRRHPLDG